MSWSDRTDAPLPSGHPEQGHAGRRSARAPLVVGAVAGLIVLAVLLVCCSPPI